MTDKKTPAVGPVEDRMVDEVVEGLVDRADASGPLCWARAGC